MENKKGIYFLLGTTAVLITVTAIIFKQPFLNILPLYISLFVGLLQSKVNRLAFLTGGLNSILYAIVYVHFKLYATAIYTVIFSTSIQFLTYFLWSRKPSGKATVFKAMKNWQRVAFVIFCVLVYAIILSVLQTTDSSYKFFDITNSILGTSVSILALFAFIEYIPLGIISSANSLCLYISMAFSNPAQITWVVYTLYSLICQLFALKKIITLYKEQRALKQ